MATFSVLIQGGIMARHGPSENWPHTGNVIIDRKSGNQDVALVLRFIVGRGRIHEDVVEIKLILAVHQIRRGKMMKIGNFL